MVIQSTLPTGAQTELGRDTVWNQAMLSQHTSHSSLERQEDQEKSWMKYRLLSSLRIFIRQENGRKAVHLPSPSYLPESKWMTFKEIRSENV